MVELGRTVRFFLNGGGDDPRPPRHNGFSAWPPARGLGRFYELHVRCRGETDPVTGYFINISHVDKAVREHVLPYLMKLVESSNTCKLPMGTVMRTALDRLQPALHGTVYHLELVLSPFHSLGIRSGQMDRMIVRQQYEFAAAHRLQVNALSVDQNQRLFGKCNNPSGHGHNYRLEIVVAAPISTDGRVLFVEQLDELVDEVVVRQFDHKHLNADMPQFKKLNPSVENIAKVIYDMLRESVVRLGTQLQEVSVWETTRTVCTYRGESDT